MFGYDHDSRLVLADWLEDQNDQRATLVRLHARYALAPHADRYAERQAEKAYYAELFRIGGWLRPADAETLQQAISPASRVRSGVMPHGVEGYHTVVLRVLEADHGVHHDTPALRRLDARCRSAATVTPAHSSEYVIRVRRGVNIVRDYTTRTQSPPTSVGWIVDQGPGNTHVYPGRHATRIDAIIHGLARRAMQRSYFGYRLIVG